MTSARQIEANRANALSSTGPKTDQGKQRASQNAIRHGLTAETVILPLEDPDDYMAFEQAVTETAVERRSLRLPRGRAKPFEEVIVEIGDSHEPSPQCCWSHYPTVAPGPARR